MTRRTHRMHRTLLVALALVASAVPLVSLPAQVATGDRVRLTRDGQDARRTGRVVRLRGDTIWLETPAARGARPDTTLAIPLTGVRRVERSTGRHRHVARNAGIGALVGVGAGMVGALTVDEDDLGWFFATRSEFGLAVGLVVGVPSATIGALTGLVPTEGWDAVPSPSAAAPSTTMPSATVPSATLPSRDRARLTVRPRVGTMRVPVRGAPPARAFTVGVTLRPR